MKKIQNESFEQALRLNVRNRQSGEKKLLFRKTQLSLLTRNGLIRFAKKVEDSDSFAVKANVEVNALELRRSPLMNLLISTMRFAKVLRSKNIFMEILRATR